MLKFHKNIHLLLILFAFPMAVHADDSIDRETVIIEILDEIPVEQSIQSLTRKHPSLAPRYQFSTVLHGFSAHVSSDLIGELEQEEEVWSIHHSEDIQTKIHATPMVSARPRSTYLSRTFTGKGVKVGVIDTGVDYTHPDLKRNYKGGYDVVDQDEDPMETLGSPKKATIHGTHVSGIIAANGRMKGVAPDAELYVYRALGPGGRGTTDQVIAAIEQAVKDGMDIINLSLGDTVNGPDLPTSVALDEAVKKGVVAVVANGNDGPGAWTIGAPGTSSRAISVGASSEAARTKTISIGKGKDMKIAPVTGSAPWEFQHFMHIVDGAKGKQLHKEKLNGKIVLLQRGEITFKEKVKRAIQSQAAGVLIYNNEEGELNASIGMTSSIPVATMTKRDGERIRDALKTGKPIAVKTNERVEERGLAPFSSRGPVIDNFDIKPDVIAPGVQIDSTVPGGKYLALQGTSMAAPFVAGVCALMKEAHPDWTPQEIKSALMTTADPLKQYHPYEQGAGRVDPKRAVDEETLLFPSSLTFGLMETGTTQRKSIIIHNKSDKRKRYAFQVPPKERFISWRVPRLFSLGPGEKKIADITIELDDWMDKVSLKDGYLKMYEDGEEIRIPYLLAMKEPNYPIGRGLEAEYNEDLRAIEVSIYLPFGADEVEYSLYEYDSLIFVDEIGLYKEVKKGLFKRKIYLSKGFSSNFYEFVTKLKKGGKELVVKVPIYIGNEVK
ncbi:S8 family serine peptidase [Pradoshia sp.]